MHHMYQCYNETNLDKTMLLEDLLVLLSVLEEAFIPPQKPSPTHSLLGVLVPSVLKAWRS